MATDETDDTKKNNENQPSNNRIDSINCNSGELNLGFVPEERRRVSIASDAIQADIDKQRKQSGTSHEDPHHRHIFINGGCIKLTIDEDHKCTEQCKGIDMRKFQYESIDSVDSQPDIRNSWWYQLCMKCRNTESGKGWEPSFWQSFCPYPFCPTYRHFARVIGLILLGLLVWGIIFSIMGKDAGPGGQLFRIAVLCIFAHLGGWIFRVLHLPGLVGMLMVGIIFQNVGLISIKGHYNEFVAILRRIALVMILTRAGLDLDPAALKRLFCTVLRIGLIPWFTEFGLLIVLSHYLLGLPWIWSMLMGSIISAVAPAVVVPCLFRLRNKGYGVAKGIPTLVIAVSGIGDASSVAAFGIVYGFMFSANSVAMNLVIGPLSIVVGIAYGLLWGLVAKYIPEKEDPFVVPLRVLLLLGGGMIAVFGSETIEMGGAGPLGCITAAFMSIYVWTKQGWEPDYNPVATAYEIFWMIFEPILFGLTGTQLKLYELDYDLFGIGIALLSVCVVARIIVTTILGIGASLNMKEKIFVAISLMAKASVQAALGPVALDSVRDKEGQPEYAYAEVVLMMCIVSVILTAPIGAMIITLGGTTMLNKTTAMPLPDGWRRTHRPSLRDIQITEEDMENDDEEQPRTPPSPKPRPSILITSK